MVVPWASALLKGHPTRCARVHPHVRLLYVHKGRENLLFLATLAGRALACIGAVKFLRNLDRDAHLPCKGGIVRGCHGSPLLRSFGRHCKRLKETHVRRPQSWPARPHLPHSLESKRYSSQQDRSRTQSCNGSEPSWH